jgi:hypothetical protein
MNRRAMMTTGLTAFFGFALPVLAQSGKLRQFHVRLKTKSKSIIGTTIEARDQNEAVVKTNKRYPGSSILNLKPDRSEPDWQRKPKR